MTYTLINIINLTPYFEILKFDDLDFSYFYIFQIFDKFYITI
jgi:hypothetical protein